MTLIPILLPILGSIPVFFMMERRQRSIYISALLAVEFLSLLLINWSGAPLRIFEMSPSIIITLGTDGLGKFFALLVSAIWLIVAVFAFQYMEHEEKPQRLLGFYVMALGALIGICLSANLVTLYMFYEMMTLMTVPFVIHSGTKAARDAGIKYLGFSVCGAALGLLGLFFLSGYWSTDLFTPGGVLDAALVTGHKKALVAAFFLMIIGFGAKAGLFPLFAWLPTAHPVAPSPASAVLSGLITKMGVVAIIRVIYYQFGAEFVSGTWAQQAALWLAIFTVFMGSMLAYKEKLLKKRLAYSTVSQVSYVLFGLLILSPEGLTGALLQVFFHAFAKNGLFLAAGAIIFYTGQTCTYQLRGIGKKLPVTMWAFALCSFSLIGIPPTGGFVSKWYLAQAGLGFGGVGVFGLAILMVSALLTAGYLLPIITEAFFPGEGYDYSSIDKIENSWQIKAPLLILGIAVVVFGAFPGIAGGMIETIVNSVF